MLRQLSRYPFATMDAFMIFIAPIQPTLLGLYDTHYLPLQQSLRPITKAFILALLPGLEEENGEFFDQVWISLPYPFACSQQDYRSSSFLTDSLRPSAKLSSFKIYGFQCSQIKLQEDPHYITSPADYQNYLETKVWF
jgi:hypothetical protein